MINFYLEVNRASLGRTDVIKITVYIMYSLLTKMYAKVEYIFNPSQRILKSVVCNLFRNTFHMDKDTARKVLQELLREHPELLEDTAQKPLSPAERKPVSTTVRTTEAVMERIDALVDRLQGTNLIDYRGNKLNRSDVIRTALEKGVKELEKLTK